MGQTKQLRMPVEMNATAVRDDDVVRPLAILPRLSEVKVADGTRAIANEAGTTLEICRADGTLLFRYESGQGRGRIVLEDESLEIGSTGDLRLRAGGEVRLEGRSVHASGRQPGVEGESVLHLGPREARLSGKAVTVAGGELAMKAQRTTLHSEELRGHLGNALIEGRRLETVADTMVQTARNFYQRVQELAQQRAGSLRTIVDETLQVTAKQVFHRAVEAYKVRADKIHLG